MNAMKQGTDARTKLINRLPALKVWPNLDVSKLQDDDVSQNPYVRGGYLENKVLANSDVERDYSSLTLYRCILLDSLKNVITVGEYDFSKNKYAILDRMLNDLNLSNAHIQGQSLELHGAKLRNVRVTSSLIENYTFKECSFIKCNFSGTRFVDVKFLGTKFYASNFEECTFKNCTFDDAYVDDDAGDDWLATTETDDRSSFKYTRFEDCRMGWFTYAETLEYSKLYTTMFKGSNIASNDLPDIM